ncbi:MAG: hypothetical protein ACQEUZ_02165 [Pseudomonadota bacterium]
MGALIRFRKQVRTPTSKLVYRPDARPALKDNASRRIPYFSPRHREMGKAAEAMAEAERAEAYPAPGPRFGEPVRALNAHAGGRRFDLCRTSEDGRTRSYEELKSHASAQHQATMSQPRADIERALGG